jgi:hypothetical protein
VKLDMLEEMGWENQVVDDVAVGITSLSYTTDPTSIAGAGEVVRLMMDELM